MSSRQDAHGGAPEARSGGGQPPGKPELGLAQPAFPAQPEPRVAGKFLGRLAISRPSAGLEGAVELFTEAAAAGFAGVQAKPQQYDLAGGDAARFASLFGSRGGLVRAGLVVYPGGDPEAWSARLVPLLAFAGRIGAEELCVCASVGRGDASPARFARIAEVLNAIGAAGRPHRVRVSLHNHAGCLFETADDLARISAGLDPALCGLTFDTAHAAKGGMTDLATPLRRLAPWITNVHLKDLAADGSFCPLGRGTLDLAAALAVLREVGYAKWLVADEETKGLGHREACTIAMRFLADHGLTQPESRP